MEETAPERRMPAACRFFFKFNQWLHRRFVLVYLGLCLAAYVIVYAGRYTNPPIRSDGVGYYAYLPALLIYQNMGMREVREAVDEDNRIAFNPARVPGYVFDKYPIGEAVLMSPFFLGADLLTILCGKERSGFSPFYQHAAGLAGLFYGVLGVYLLKKILDGFFPAAVTLAVLVAICFGTDLFHYATYDSIFSHSYSFFLFCALVCYLPIWVKAPNARRSLLLGVIFGMICLTRNPNALVGGYAALFVLGSLPDFRQRLAFLWRNGGNLALIAAVPLVLFIPQLCYWKFTMGTWLLNSYGSQNEAFTFLSPHLGGVLFSLRKGLFVWSPVLLLAVAGLAKMKGAFAAYRWPVIAFLCVNTYVIASWGCWYYGGSFGHRGFVESLVFFALGLGCFYKSLRSRGAKIAAGVFSAFCVAYSLVAMYGYWRHVVPFDESTAATFQRLLTPQTLAGMSAAVLLTSPFWLVPVLWGGAEKTSQREC